ncbi:MAG: hypothetical protein WCQ95_13990 [Bacteroidota bacterium]
MPRPIRVHKTLGKIPILVKVAQNENVANKLLQYPQVVNPPHTTADYLLLTAEVKDYYTQHLTGNHKATLKMYEADKKMAIFYYETAQYIELLANQLLDSALPIGVGFRVFAIPKTRSRKGLVVKDGASAGDILIEYSRIKGALAYRVEVAEVVKGSDPQFRHGAAGGITAMTVTGLKPDTKYMIHLVPIFSRYEDLTLAPIAFRTKEDF